MKENSKIEHIFDRTVRRVAVFEHRSRVSAEVDCEVLVVELSVRWSADDNLSGHYATLPYRSPATEDKMIFRSIRIVTTDVPGSAHLFAQLLGKTAEGSAEYMEVPVGDIVLAFCSPEALGAATPGLSGSVPGTQILEFDVGDLGDIEDKLGDGVEVIQEAATQPWGNRSMIVRTDNGTLVNFFTPVSDAARTWPSQS